jgi:hypothetical protein
MQNHQKMKVLRSIHVYGTAPAQRQARRRSNLDALPFGRLWYVEVSDAIGYAQHYSRAHDAVIRVYDAAGKVIERHAHARRFHVSCAPLASRALTA